MIQVFVIASTPLLLAGLRSMLTSAEIQVAGEALVPDASMEDITGIDVMIVADGVLLEDVVRTMAGNSTVALIALTDNDEQALSLLKTSGLRGWGIGPISASASQLHAMVIAVSQGAVILPAPLVKQLHTDTDRHSIQAVQLEAPDESLTTREREVLELVSQGLSNKLVARQLQISEHTVKFHISSISTKLGALSRTDAVRLGLRKGLITL